MKTVAILQGRMRSTRLPGKVLSEIAGEPMLVHVIRRLQRTRTVNHVVVATTTNEADDPVVDIAKRQGVGWFRGAEDDVLRRYVGAAGESQAELVVRVTADCPLLDPGVVDRVVAAAEPGVDYASNVIDRTFPVGLDTEVLTHAALLRIDELATSPEAREHVTWFVRSERPDLFVRRSVTDSDDNSDLRWVVDTREDLERIRLLYGALDLGRKIKPYDEVIEYERGRGSRGALDNAFGLAKRREPERHA